MVGITGGAYEADAGFISVSTWARVLYSLKANWQNSITNKTDGIFNTKTVYSEIWLSLGYYIPTVIYYTLSATIITSESFHLE